MHAPDVRVSRDTSARAEGPVREPLCVESNDQKEAARALEMLHVQLISAVIDPYSWKWVIVTLHHALHAFAAASLSEGGEGSSGDTESAGLYLRLRPSQADKYLQGVPDHLPEIYERMKAATRFHLADELDRDISRLVEMRNAIILQVPASWSLRVNELPRLTQNCLRLVEFLGWNPGHIAWHKESLTDLARVKFLASIKVLEALDGQYNA